MMKKLLLLFATFVALIAFKFDNNLFRGRIVYEYAFTDLEGNDINGRMAPYLGSGQHYYIDGSNYKSLHQGRLRQLYNSESNTYYALVEDGSAQQYDGGLQTSQKFIVTPVDKTEKVGGYECKAIQVETDDAVTVYYYSPDIRTDRQVFAKHSFGEWNRYLEATDGALALKFVMTSKKGFVWTSTATEVSRMDFGADDFVLPESVEVK